MSPKVVIPEPQLEALFNEASKDMVPADPKSIPITHQLAPYRKKLLEYRDRGYSSDQLVKIMAYPKIGITVSPSFLRRYLCPSGKRGRKALPVTTGLPPRAAVSAPPPAK